MYRKVFCGLIIFCYLLSCSQEEVSPPIESPQPEALFKIIEDKLPVHFRNIDSALVYSNKMLALAGKMNIPQQLGRAHNARASALEQIEQYDSAIWHFQKALPSLIQANDTTGLAFNYTGLGHVYLYKGMHDLALIQYQKSLTLLTNSTDNNALSKAYSDLGIVLMKQGMYSEAISHYEQAIDLAAKEQIIQSQLPPMLNMSLAYLRQGDYDSAIYHASRLKSLAEQIKMDFGIGKATYILAEAFTEKGEFNRADKEARIGENIFTALRSERDLSGLKYQRARISHKLGKNREALQIIDKMLSQIINEELEVDVLKLKAEIYEAQGQSTKALSAFKAHMDALATQARKKNERLIVQQQFKFDTERKNQQIRDLQTNATITTLKLKQERILLYILLASILVFILLAVMLFKQHKSKVQNEVMELQNKLLRTQLNPHFLFNAMGAIQQYIYSNEDPQLISDYLGRFSRLTRMILNYSKQELITLEEELEFLNIYISLQQIRFEIPFEFELDLSKTLDTEQLLVPPMLTQPFIENAIEHGFLHKEEQGHIKLSIAEYDGQLHIKVQDDGIGRTQATTLTRKTKHESMATQITIDRLKLLQRKLRQKSDLLIKDLRDSQHKVSGTLVELNIPIIKD